MVFIMASAGVPALSPPRKTNLSPFTVVARGSTAPGDTSSWIVTILVVSNDHRNNGAPQGPAHPCSACDTLFTLSTVQLVYVPLLAASEALQG